MQLECNRGSSIIQWPQKKTEKAAIFFGAKWHARVSRAAATVWQPSSLASLEHKKKNKGGNRGVQPRLRVIKWAEQLRGTEDEGAEIFVLCYLYCKSTISEPFFDLAR